jgi:hypothetical protein
MQHDHTHWKARDSLQTEELEHSLLRSVVRQTEQSACKRNQQRSKYPFQASTTPAWRLWPVQSCPAGTISICCTLLRCAACHPRPQSTHVLQKHVLLLLRGLNPEAAAAAEAFGAFFAPAQVSRYAIPFHFSSHAQLLNVHRPMHFQLLRGLRPSVESTGNLPGRPLRSFLPAWQGRARNVAVPIR